jgi:hypothetical protein
VSRFRATPPSIVLYAGPTGRIPLHAGHDLDGIPTYHDPPAEAARRGRPFPAVGAFLLTPAVARNKVTLSRRERLR